MKLNLKKITGNEKGTGLFNVQQLLHSSFPMTVSIFSTFVAGSIVVCVAWPIASYILWSLTSSLSKAIFCQTNMY